MPLRRMIDEWLPRWRNLSRSAFPRRARRLLVRASTEPARNRVSTSVDASVSSSLFDQSALTELAARLVDAARRAGAEAADAVGVRSESLAVEVRDGAVEESERSGGGDVGLCGFVGRRQAVD